MRFSVSPMYLSYTAEVSNFTSGSFHSPATARAQRDFPHPCTPRTIMPRGGSSPNSRAESSQAPLRCASHCFRFSRPADVHHLVGGLDELHHFRTLQERL